MLSKEEVLEIIAYCDSNGVTRKSRLKELGIGEWAFYEAKRRYLQQESESGVSEGSFIELKNSEGFVPDSVTAIETSSRSARRKKSVQRSELQIECQTSRGGLIRISGLLTPAMLTTLIQNL